MRKFNLAIAVLMMTTIPALAGEPVHTVIASSFADTADIIAFKKCKRQGKTDHQCFAVGDNGIGYWGDDTTDVDKPMCALPRGVWKARWGAGQAARGKKIEVRYNGKTVVCELRDTLPAKPKHGVGIDLSPGAQKAFGKKPPFLLHGVQWKWAEGQR